MRAGAMIAVCLIAACYNYAPVNSVAPEAGAEFAFTLTEAGSRELARSLGPDVFVVRGRYLGGSDRGVLVSVSSVELKRGDVLPWAGETIALPESDIAGTEARRLAKGRSALLIGASVTGLVATTAAFVLAGGGTRPGNAGPPPVKQ